MVAAAENGSVKIDRLRKTFGRTVAVDDVSFSFHRGQVHGFIGPNGAGKTTTMRILSTIDSPSGGDADVMGHSIVDYPWEVRKKIGFVPDWFTGFEYTTVHEYLDFFARACGLGGRKRIESVGAIEDFTGLDVLREKLITELSRGMQQRVCLGRSLVNDPAVMLLDEPAANLDPRARIELRELVKALAAQGKAILISSHILAELSEICDSVTIIDKGKILATGTISQIKKTMRPHIVLSVKALCDEELLEKAALEIPMAVNPRFAGKDLLIDFTGDENDVPAILKLFVDKGIPVVEFKSREEGLEDLFMKITGADEEKKAEGKKRK